MTGASADEQSELGVELNRLILRRARVALCFGLATVAMFLLVNHTRPSPPPWSDVMNLITTLLIGVGFAMLARPAIQRRPVPFCILIFDSGCVLRAHAGIVHGDGAPAAITRCCLAVVAASTVPWGPLPQAIVATIAGVAIAANSYLVEGNFGPPSGQAAGAVVLGVVLSVVLAIELQRHRMELLIE